jgi:hypothetical protein
MGVPLPRQCILPARCFCPSPFSWCFCRADEETDAIPSKKKKGDTARLLEVGGGGESPAAAGIELPSRL